MLQMKNIVQCLGLILAVLVAAGPMTAMAKPAKPATPAGNPFDATPADHMLGDPNAKITVVEYGSVACPGCAHFNETAFPQFKAKYIDTGKVRYVFRPMLTGVPTVAMAGTRLAECAGKDKYFSVIDAVMRGQHEFYPSGETDIFAHAVLVRIAKSYGLDEPAFNKCVTDPDGVRQVNQGYNNALASGVRSTPTFFVNGKRLDDSSDLDAAIAAAQPKP